MITTAEFKKQISKPFGLEMRRCGFKGTGFEFFQETNDYLIAVCISPGRWGGRCSAVFAIHPKEINKDSHGKLDLKRLKFYDYEFKMSLTRSARGEWWDYADDESTNLETLSKILNSIKKRAFPVIEQFKAKPNILEQFKVSEMNSFHAHWTKKTGVSIATTELRFAWAMTVIFEKKNPIIAKRFAKWALSKADDSDDEWFGDKDFIRVLSSNNGA